MKVIVRGNVMIFQNGMCFDRKKIRIDERETINKHVFQPIADENQEQKPTIT